GFDLGSPAVNDAGVVVAEARRNALHRLEAGNVRTLLAVGQVVDGVETIDDISHFEYAGRNLFVVAEGTSAGMETDALFIDRGTGPRKVLASGQPTPIGGTFSGIDSTVDAA